MLRDEIYTESVSENKETSVVKLNQEIERLKRNITIEETDIQNIIFEKKNLFEILREGDLESAKRYEILNLKLSGAQTNVKAIWRETLFLDDHYENGLIQDGEEHEESSCAPTVIRSQSVTVEKLQKKIDEIALLKEDKIATVKGEKDDRITKLSGALTEADANEENITASTATVELQTKVEEMALLEESTNKATKVNEKKDDEISKLSDSLTEANAKVEKITASTVERFKKKINEIALLEENINKAAKVNEEKDYEIKKLSDALTEVNAKVEKITASSAITVEELQTKIKEMALLEENINKAAIDNEKKDDEIRKLSDALTEANSKVEKITASSVEELQTKIKDMALLEENINKTGKNNEKKDDQIKKLSDALTKANAKIEKITASSAITVEELQTKIKEIALLDENINKAAIDNEKKEDEIRKLSDALTEANSKVEKITASTVKKLKKKIEEIASLKADIIKAAKINEEKDDKIRKLSNALTEADSKVETITASTATSVEELQTKIKEMATLEEMINKATTVNEEKDDEIRKLNDALTEADAKVEKLTASLATTVEELQTKIKEMATLEENNKKATKDNEEKDDEIRKLTDALTEVDAKMEKLAASTATTVEELQTKIKEMAILEENNKKATKDNEEKDEEIRKLNDALTEADAKVEKLTASLATTVEELQTKIKEMATLKENNKKATKDNEEKDDEIRKLTDALTEVDAKMENLAASTATTVEELQTKIKEVATLEEIINNATKVNEEKDDEIRKLNDALTEADAKTKKITIDMERITNHNKIILDTLQRKIKVMALLEENVNKAAKDNEKKDDEIKKLSDALTAAEAKTKKIAVDMVEELQKKIERMSLLEQDINNAVKYKEEKDDEIRMLTAALTEAFTKIENIASDTNTNTNTNPNESTNDSFISYEANSIFGHASVEDDDGIRNLQWGRGNMETEQETNTSQESYRSPDLLTTMNKMNKAIDKHSNWDRKLEETKVSLMVRQEEVKKLRETYNIMQKQTEKCLRELHDKEEVHRQLKEKLKATSVDVHTVRRVTRQRQHDVRRPPLSALTHTDANGGGAADSLHAPPHLKRRCHEE